MCGISGFTFRDQALIEKMNESLKHRGPDGGAVFVDQNISLGHRRLSIIDLSNRASQPMHSDDGRYVIVFNGEIYNFADIRRELVKKGYQFHSDGDTEVILQAYRAYGKQCVEHFNGIFAFAIWDKQEEELFAARDRIGVKPLYYHFDGKKLVFASEIKSLLKYPLERRVNPKALTLFFRLLYVPGPETMFQDVCKLPPASYFTFKKGKFDIQKYWELTPAKGASSYEEARARVRSLVEESVHLQLVSDRPLGVFLSGGIDSTAIAALAQKELAHPLKTFSVGYDIVPEKFSADASLAKQTSKTLGTDHHELVVTGQDCADNLMAAVYHMDEPLANATQLSTYLLSKFTVKDAVVVLGGDGGDELFGGYDRYRYSRMISDYQRLPPTLREALATIFQPLEAKYPALCKLHLPPGSDRYLTFMAQKEAEALSVIAPGVGEPGVPERFLWNQLAGRKFNSPEEELMWVDVMTWLPDESLIRSDKMSMAFGLEQRVPLLDHRLVEYAFAISTEYKIDWFHTKKILKDAMKDLIPPVVLKQPKRGWFSPASEWLRRELQPIAYEAFNPRFAPGSEQLLNLPKLESLLDDHVARRAYNMNLLWAGLTFQMWYRQFIVEKK